MRKIYERNNWIILESESQYILVNKSKEFQNGHTHLRNYDTALWLIKLVDHKSLPYHISDYLLESLVRVSEDIEYIRKLKELQVTRGNQSKPKYYNSKNYRQRKSNHK